jgi:CHAT domain-containing protein
VFERYAADPGVTRAEALRQSMLALMQSEEKDTTGRPSFPYSHPLFWAPYALVGDGAR